MSREPFGPAQAHSDENLAPKGEYQKLWVNLAPIISAPAAKGNFSNSPRDSHHRRGCGLWRHTQGELLSNFSQGTPSLCLPLQTKPRVVCGMPGSNLGRVDFFFLQNLRRCPQQVSDSLRRSETEGLNRISDTKEPSLIVGLPSAGGVFYGPLSVQILYKAKQAIFTLLTPFPSRICHTTLVGGTWSQSTIPHQRPCGVTSTIQHWGREEKNEEGPWKRTGRCWKQLKPVSHKNYSFFCSF